MANIETIFGHHAVLAGLDHLHKHMILELLADTRRLTNVGLTLVQRSRLAFSTQPNIHVVQGPVRLNVYPLNYEGYICYQAIQYLHDTKS